MQDIIQKIIEIDRRAQKMTADARAMRDEAASSIESDKKRLRDKYIAEARHRIEITDGTERKLLDETLTEIRQKYAAVSQRLDKLAQEQNDKWVDDLYHRVIG